MIINEKSTPKYLWDSLILFFITGAAIEIPLRLVLKLEHTVLQTSFFTLLTIVFIADIFVQKYTTITPYNSSTKSKHPIRAYYSRSFLVIDSIASIPFEFLYLLIIPESHINDTLLYAIRMTHLIKLLRINFYIKRWQRIFNLHPSILRLSTFIFIIGIFAHWISCCWMVLVSNTRTITEYVDALYWCITTLTTVGYGDVTPQNIPQKIFTMIVMLLGAGTYGYIIGNISSILANLDVAKTHFNEKISKVNTFLKSYNVPTKTSIRVNDYYSYLWKTNRGYDSQEILDELPDTLKLELQIHLTRSIIQKVPLFKHAEDKMITEIVSKLTASIFTPGDTIFYHGDIGDTIYFINRGAVEILSADESTVYSTLSEGSFFGEVALLLEQPRNATVRAVDFCNLYSLDNTTFKKIISHFPEFEREVRLMAQQRS